MIDLVIFDMDGVLVDSEEAIASASILSLREYGVPDAKLADFKPFTGMGDDIFIGGVAGKYGVEYDAAMKLRAYEFYMENLHEIFVFKWSKHIIEKLSEQGMKVSVASASDRVKVEANISRVGVDMGIFSSVVTGTDVKNKKPDPEIFIKAAAKADIPCERCLVVEDSLAGIMAAKSAGMVCVAVNTSFGFEELKKAGADYTVDDLCGLDEIVHEINS